MAVMWPTDRLSGLTDVARSRSTRAAEALAHLPEVDPALASLALWCDMQDCSSAHTYVSGDTVFVGTSFDRLPLQEQIGVIGRHILHIALRHEYALCTMQTRQGTSFRPDIHNLCAAALVNEYLLRAGHALPRPTVLLRDVVRDVLAENPGNPHDPLSQMTADKLYYQLIASDPETHQRLDAFSHAKKFEPDIYPDAPDPLADRSVPDWQAHLIRAYQAGGGSGRGIGPVLRTVKLPPISRTPWERQLRGLMAIALCHKPRQSFRRPRSNWIARDADASARGLPRPVFEPRAAAPDSEAQNCNRRRHLRIRQCGYPVPVRGRSDWHIT